MLSRSVLVAIGLLGAIVGPALAAAPSYSSSTGDCRYGGASGYEAIGNLVASQTKAQCEAICEANGDCVAYDRDSTTDATPSNCYIFAQPPSTTAYSGDGTANHMCFVRSGRNPWGVVKNFGRLVSTCTSSPCVATAMEIGRCYKFPISETTAGVKTYYSAKFTDITAATSGKWSVYSSADCSGTAVASYDFTYGTCAVVSLLDSAQGTASYSTTESPDLGVCTRGNVGMTAPVTVRMWPSSATCSSSSTCYAISSDNIGATQASATCVTLTGCTGCGVSAKVWQESGYAINEPTFAVTMFDAANCAGTVVKAQFNVEPYGICGTKDSWGMQLMSGNDNSGTCTLVHSSAALVTRIGALVIGLVAAVAVALI